MFLEPERLNCTTQEQWYSPKIEQPPSLVGKKGAQLARIFFLWALIKNIPRELSSSSWERSPVSCHILTKFWLRQSIFLKTFLTKSLSVSHLLLVLWIKQKVSFGGAGSNDWIPQWNWIRDSYKATMKKMCYNEFEEDIVNYFGREIQLCTTRAKKGLGILSSLQ